MSIILSECLSNQAVATIAICTTIQSYGPLKLPCHTTGPHGVVDKGAPLFIDLCVH